jgi:Rps23 Pro-64 3,4-dihydroxylase Tpa1-like proline 4-hydroxylase
MTAVPGAPEVQAPDIERLAESLRGRHDEFEAARPFPHVVVDDLLPPAVARAMVDEFPAADAPGWQHFHHVNEKKLVCTDLTAMGPVTRDVIAALQAQLFLDALEGLTATPRLLSDPEMDGGGLQQTRPGGFLNVHTDFLSHTKRRTWSRQLNLLLFLNPGWEPSHHGWLELWDADATRCVRRIEPLFNRCVIFRTGRASFHGVPAGVACPPDDSRKGLALYYFRDEGRPCRLEPTHYVPLPGDSLHRRAMIRLDRWMVHGYSVLKRYTPLADRLATRILRRF